MGNMQEVQKKSITDSFENLTYLDGREPNVALTNEAEKAFAQLLPYRDGAIFVGHYSGSSAWERHTNGDEIVFVVEGKTTVITRQDENENSIDMHTGDMIVVPKGTWHRFHNSDHLKVLTVTPQPTEHRPV